MPEPPEGSTHSGDRAPSPGEAGSRDPCMPLMIGEDAVVHFAVIGDYGDAGPDEEAVAGLLSSFAPDLILTTGDNNYPAGSAETIDLNIGQYFSEYICPYRGVYGPGGQVNRFFPSPGNHDWGTGDLTPYLDYFTLPGNERYYAFTQGSVHFFAVDSSFSEPDGNTPDSAQAAWLQQALRASTARWKIVYMHHPPYSSGSHGSSLNMRWDYAAWGADVVFAGHDHTYERLLIDGVTYVVTGVGGRPTYAFGPALDGGQFRATNLHGAVFAAAGSTELVLQFIDTDGVQHDRAVLH